MVEPERVLASKTHGLIDAGNLAKAFSVSTAVLFRAEARGANAGVLKALAPPRSARVENRAANFIGSVEIWVNFRSRKVVLRGRESCREQLKALVFEVQKWIGSMSFVILSFSSLTAQPNLDKLSSGVGRVVGDVTGVAAKL